MTDPDDQSLSHTLSSGHRPRRPFRSTTPILFSATSFNAVQPEIKPMNTPGGNLLFAQLLNSYDHDLTGRLPRNALEAIVVDTMPSVDPAQHAEIIEHLLGSLGEDADGMVSSENFDGAFQSEMRPRWEQLFGDPGKLLFEEHLKLCTTSRNNQETPSLPVQYVIEVLEDQDIAAEHAMLLVQEFAADVEVGLCEAEFLVACIKEPSIINNIFHLDPPRAGGSSSIDSSYIAEDDDPDAAFHAAVADDQFSELHPRDRIQSGEVGATERMKQRITKDASRRSSGLYRPLNFDIDNEAEMSEAIEKTIDYESVESEIRVLKKRLSELIDVNNATTACVEGRDEKLAQYKKECDALAASVDQQMPAEEGADLTAQEASQKKIDALDAELEQMKVAMTAIVKAIKSICAEVNDISETGKIPEFRNSPRDITSIRTLSTSVMPLVHVEEIDNVAATLGTVLQGVIKLLEAKDELRQSYVDLEEREKKKDENLLVMERKVSEQQGHFTQLVEERRDDASTISGLKQELLRLKAEIDSAHSGSTVEAELLASLRAEVAELTRNLAEKQTAKEATEQDAAGKAQQIEALETELSKTRVDFEVGLVALQTELDVACKDGQDSKIEVGHLTNKVQIHETKITVANGRIASLNAKLKASEADFKTHDETLSCLKAANSELQVDLTKIHAVATELRASESTLLVRLEKANAELAEHLVDYKAHKTMAATELAAWETKHDVLQVVAVERAAVNANQASKIEALERELAESTTAATSAAATSAASGSACADIKTSEARIGAIEPELDTTKQLLDEAGRSIESLKAELESIRATLAQANTVGKDAQSSRHVIELQLDEAILNLQNAKTALVAANVVIEELKVKLASTNDLYAVLANKETDSMERATQAVGLQETAESELAGARWQLAQQPDKLTQATEIITHATGQFDAANKKIEVLTTDITVANDRIALLMSQPAVTSNSEAAAEALTAATDELNRMAQSIQSLREADARRKAALDTVEVTCQIDAANFKRLLAAESCKLMHAMARAKTAEIMLAELKVESVAVAGRLKASEQRCGAMHQQLNESGAAAKVADGANAEAMADANHQIELLQAKIATLNENSAAREQELLTTKAAQSTAENNLAQARNQFAAAEQAAGATSRELRSLKVQHGTLSSATANTKLQLEAMERQLQSLRLQLATQDSEAMTTISRAANAEAERDVSVRELAVLRADLQRTKDERENIFRKHQELMEQSSKSFAEASQATILEEDVARLQSTVAELEKERSMHQTDISELRMQVIQSDASAAALRQEADAAKKTIGGLRKEHAATNESLHASAPALDIDVGSLRRALRDAESERDALEARFTEKEGRLQQAAQLLKATQTKASVMQSNLAIAEAAVGELERALSNNQQAQQQAEHRLQAALRVTHRAKEAIDEAEYATVAEKARVNQRDQDIAAAMAKISGLEQQVASANAAQEQIAVLSDTIERVRGRFDADKKRDYAADASVSLAIRLAQKDSELIDARDAVTQLAAAGQAKDQMHARQLAAATAKLDRSMQDAAMVLADRTARLESALEQAKKDADQHKGVVEDLDHAKSEQDALANKYNELQSQFASLQASIQTSTTSARPSPISIDTRGLDDDDDDNDDNGPSFAEFARLQNENTRLKTTTGVLIAEIFNLRGIWHNEADLATISSRHGEKLLRKLVPALPQVRPEWHPQTYIFNGLEVLMSQLADNLDLPVTVTVALSTSHLQLMRDNSRVPIKVWPTSHIKRFGFDKTVCSVEFGHASDAPGVLFFDAESSQAMFNRLEQCLHSTPNAIR